MRKLKIGILVESFPRISQTWLDNQIIDLLARGHDVSIFSVYPTPDTIIHQQVKINRLQEKTQYFFYPRSKSARDIWGGLKYAIRHIGNTSGSKIFKAIKAVLKKEVEPLFVFNYVFLKGMENLDILHAHFGDMGVFAAKMKKAGLLVKPKVVVSFHGHDIFHYKKEIYQRQYRIFEEYTDALLVNSEYSKSLLYNILNLPNVKILPVGLISSNFLPPIRLDKQELQILFVGRLVVWKGPVMAVEIFEMLKKKYDNIKLTIVGDGEQLQQVNRTVKALNLEESVILKGALAQEDIIHLMGISDIFLFPAGYERSQGAADTQGLVIQESQIMELPVVCGNVGGISSGLLDGETGFLVKEGDIDGFVEKIQFLIDNPELRRKMGRAGREFVKDNFDSKVIGDKLMGIYANILHDN